FDHAADVAVTVREDRPLVRDDQRTVPDGPLVPGTVSGAGRDDARPSGTIGGAGGDGIGPAARGGGRAARPPWRTVPARRAGAVSDARDVADLIPAARAAPRCAGGGRAAGVARRVGRPDARGRARGVQRPRRATVKILKAEAAVTALSAPVSSPLNKGTSES